MDNLLFSINAVLPLFLVMVFGIVLKRIHILDESGAKQMNAILFNFALPTKMFLDSAGADLGEMMDVPFIIYCVSITLIWFFICWGIAHIFLKERETKGAFVQGAFRSNYAIIGIPLITNILGSSPPKAALITTFVIPIFNTLSVIILTVYSGENKSLKETFITAVKNVAKNPIIRGILLGVLVSVIGLKLPVFLHSTLVEISGLTTPIALISIGASMDFSKVRKRIAPALWVCFLKLAAMPLIFMSIALLMNMSNENLAILFVLVASPTAVSSYVMAVNMGSDEYLAANVILLSSLLSVFTFTIGVYALRVMAVI